MITPVLKFTDIKKDQNVLLGISHAYICKRGDVVAHVVSNERMNELLEAEQKSAQFLDDLKNIANGKLHPSDLINLIEE